MRISIPRVHGATPREKLLRSLALVLVFAAVAWAFVKNNEHVVEALNRNSAVYDETNTLDKEQRKFIASFTRALKDDFGLSSRIQIFGGDFVTPELDGKTLYIGLAPSIREARVRFPGLMRSALGDGFAEELERGRLAPAMERGDWPQELEVVLAEIYKRLEKLNKDTAGE